jgi:hypothetical protein
MSKPKYVIRPYIEADLPFILNSWITNYRCYSIDAKLVKDFDMVGYHQRIRQCLNRPETRIIVAGDGDVICGWLCYDDKAFHYGYVKGPFRQFGIFTALVKHAGGWGAHGWSHWTWSLERMSQHIPQILYTPSPFWSRKDAK